MQDTLFKDIELTEVATWAQHLMTVEQKPLIIPDAEKIRKSIRWNMKPIRG